MITTFSAKAAKPTRDLAQTVARQIAEVRELHLAADEVYRAYRTFHCKIPTSLPFVRTSEDPVEWIPLSTH
jgi:hypothetical protein